MSKLLIVLAAVAILVLLALAIQAHFSRNGELPGLFDGQLRPCPDSPNCVCSEFPADAGHFVEPIDIDGLPAAETMALLREVIVDLGGEIEVDYGEYVGAVFTSAVFGFADDFEVRLDAERRLIHVRAAARAGYSDFGVNRERVERVKQRLRENT